MKAYLLAVQNLFKTYPKGLYVLFYTEMWELFGRFGILSILVLYLTRHFNLSDAKAFSIFGAFAALNFLTPILGGLICDRLLGNRQSILLGAVMMVLGNALLVIPSFTVVMLGLSVITIGSGFFMPSIAPLVGALYAKQDAIGRDAGFTLYYLGRNMGALLAPLFCGLIGERFGYHYAFVLTVIGMSSGIYVFLKGQRHLGDLGLAPNAFLANRFLLLSVLGVGACFSIFAIFYVLLHDIAGYVLLMGVCLVCSYLFFLMKSRDRLAQRHVISIVVLMLFVIIFESFLNQGATMLNLFIDRIVDRKIFNFALPTSFFYSLDPLFMLFLAPLLSALWIFLSKRAAEPSVVSKFILSLIFLSLGFLIFVFAANHAIIRAHVSPCYVVFAYMIFPLAELCIVPIGLSMVTRLAPKGLDALMVGLWMLSNAIAGFLGGKIAFLGKIPFAMETTGAVKHAAVIYQHAFSVIVMSLSFAAVLLILLAPRIKRLMRGS